MNQVGGGVPFIPGQVPIGGETVKEIPAYNCPVHGKVTEVISFARDASPGLEKVNDHYCMLCLREYLQKHIGSIELI